MAQLLLVSTIAGCLVPQPNQYFEDIPAQRNRSPAFVSWTPTAFETLATVGTITATCKPSDAFQVTINEPDGDTVQALWYVYAPQNFAIDMAPAGYPTPIYGTDSTDPSKRMVTAPGAVAAALGNAQVGTKVVVEVFVTDSDFASDTSGLYFFPATGKRRPLDLPDGGRLQDDAYVINLRWLVTVVTCK